MSLIRIVPPEAGQVCREHFGVRVEMPDGTPLPGVLSVHITMDADDRVRASIEVLADAAVLSLLPEDVKVFALDPEGKVAV